MNGLKEKLHLSWDTHGLENRAIYGLTLSLILLSTKTAARCWGRQHAELGWILSDSFLKSVSVRVNLRSKGLVVEGDPLLVLVAWWLRCAQAVFLCEGKLIFCTPHSYNLLPESPWSISIIIGLGGLTAENFCSDAVSHKTACVWPGQMRGAWNPSCWDIQALRWKILNANWSRHIVDLTNAEITAFVLSASFCRQFWGWTEAIKKSWLPNMVAWVKRDNRRSPVHCHHTFFCE